jgi:hypothetical protein
MNMNTNRRITTVSLLLLLTLANYSFTANQPLGKQPRASAASPPPTPAKTWPPAPLGKYQSVPPRKIDPATLSGKLVFGYQGWFSAAGDGSPMRAWNHWSNDHRKPNVGTVRVALWPDMSEFEPDELYDTDLRYPDGSVGRRFLPLDADGETLPNDWYLKLADYAGRMLRKEIAPIPARPIDP